MTIIRTILRLHNNSIIINLFHLSHSLITLHAITTPQKLKEILLMKIIIPQPPTHPQQHPSYH